MSDMITMTAEQLRALEMQIADLELALFAENQKRLETEQLRDQLVAPLEDAVRLLRAAGYAMSGTATTPMLAIIATAKAAQLPVMAHRECGCGWCGAQDDCMWCGGVGPLCPKCHETTEVSPPAIAQPVAQGGSQP